MMRFWTGTSKKVSAFIEILRRKRSSFYFCRKRATKVLQIRTPSSSVRRSSYVISSGPRLLHVLTD